MYRHRTPLSSIFSKGVALALTLLWTAGCAGRYQITLTNNHLITTRGKPQYVKERNVYEYKNLKGEITHVPAIRVKMVEPLYRFDKPEAPPHPLAESD
jgi:hypothetical protein